MTSSHLSPLRHAAEPLLRRVLHVYWRFARGLTVGVRAVVIDDAGRVLLIRHSYVDGWHFPGGGVEVGETMLQALARELREEANVELAGEPELHGIFYNGRISRRDHVAVYVVRRYRQDSVPVANHEIVAHGFHAIDALPADTTPGTRARIAEVVKGRAKTEYW